MNVLWDLMKPHGRLPNLALIDVRDVARALVAALTAPPASQVGRKRIPTCVPSVQASDVADLIKKERPELAHRLPLEAIKAAPQVGALTANERLKEVLGLEVTDWRTTILESLDALVRLEDHWKARGMPIY